MTTPPRTCTECGTALAEDANPRRKYCSDHCRYAHRDRQPERKAADAERHRRRYHEDHEFRDRRRRYDLERKRRAAGIPLDRPLSNRGRRRMEEK